MYRFLSTYLIPLVEYSIDHYWKNSLDPSLISKLLEALKNEHQYDYKNVLNIVEKYTIHSFCNSNSKLISDSFNDQENFKKQME